MRTHIVTRVVVSLLVAAGGMLTGPARVGAEECTTLLAGAAATPTGGPLIWKNRDTTTLSNKVIRVEEHPYSFLALVDTDDTAGRAAWAGVNTAGFAIANSASYNLPKPADELQEQEGVVMAEALRTCRTVGDFEALIARRQGKRLGVRTNFFAIDAEGGAVIIEVHNHGYTRYAAASFPGQRVPNSNFSRSGKEHEGAGYLRFDRENQILRTIGEGQLNAETVFHVLARDLGHPLLRHPAREEWKELPEGEPYWVHSNYTIDRPSTAATVVIQGVRPGQDPAYTTMWVALGEPVTAIAVPVWVSAGTPPDELWQGKDAPLSVEASRLKALLRPLPSRERGEYADVTRLDNAAGTGWLPALLDLEHDITMETDALLGKKPCSATLAAHQKSMAGRALAALKAIQPKVRPAPPEGQVLASLAAPAIAEGILAQQQRKHQDALTAFGKAIAIDPGNADAQLLRCRSLAGLRQYGDAIAACTESLRLRPDQPEALRDRGTYSIRAGNVDSGLADLTRAVMLAPRDRYAQNRLGFAHYLKGAFASAASAFEHCTIGPNDDLRVECQAWLLPSLMRAGRKDAARRLLATVTAPSKGDPSDHLDRILLFKGTRTEAQVAATMSKGPAPEATVGYSLGVWHLLNGRVPKAREYFNRAVASGQSHACGYRAAEAELRRLDVEATRGGVKSSPK